MTEGSPNEFSTIYTALHYAQNLTASLDQGDIVTTLDLAIHAKPKQFQFKYPDEFGITVIRPGGFYIVLNYLSLLGKKFHNSGIEDLFIESDAYAEGSTTKLMKEKSYNRGI